MCKQSTAVYNARIQWQPVLMLSLEVETDEIADGNPKLISYSNYEIFRSSRKEVMTRISGKNGLEGANV